MWKNYFLGIESPKQRKVARDRAAEGEEGRGSLEWHKKEPLEEQVVIEIGQDAFMEKKKLWKEAFPVKLRENSIGLSQFNGSEMRIQKSESDGDSCPTLRNPMNCSLPGSSAFLSLLKFA